MSNIPLITLLSVTVLLAGLAYLRENRLRRAAAAPRNSSFPLADSP